jgi:hypothetical protein
VWTLESARTLAAERLEDIRVKRGFKESGRLPNA